MNWILRTIFFMTALAPAAIVNVGLQINANGFKFEYGCWLLGGLISCLLPFLIVIAIRRQGEVLPFVAKKVESNEWLLIPFICAYVLPLAIKVDNETLVVALLVASFLSSFLTAIPNHPLLHFAKYKFYKVEGEGGIVYTLVARRKILDASDIKFVRAISNQLLIEG